VLGGCVPRGGSGSRSWGINAFGVTPKAFSRVPKRKKLVHNVQPYKSEITHAKSSKPPRMFQRDAVDASPDLAVKMSSKPKWLFDIIGGRHERN